MIDGEPTDCTLLSGVPWGQRRGVPRKEKIFLPEERFAELIIAGLTASWKTGKSQRSLLKTGGIGSVYLGIVVNISQT